MNNRIKYSFLAATFLITSLKADTTDFYCEYFDTMMKSMEATRQYMEEQFHHMQEQFRNFKAPQPLLEVKMDEATVLVEIPVKNDEGIKVRGSAQEVEVEIEQEDKKTKAVITFVEQVSKFNPKKVYTVVVRAEEEKDQGVRTQEVQYGVSQPVQLETVQSEYEKEKGVLRLTFKLNVPEKRDIPVATK